MIKSTGNSFDNETINYIASGPEIWKKYTHIFSVYLSILISFLDNDRLNY